jgi:hypothetical protein
MYVEYFNIIVFLFQLGKRKPMRKIKDWSSHIVKHFWYCANVCRKEETTSDLEALKVMKVLLFLKFYLY